MKISKTIPLFMSPNMSPGINAMAHCLETLACEFGDGEIQVEEIHHKQKKDTPSGTALFLQEALKKGRGSKGVIPIFSLRGGDIFGVHKVYFFSKGEWLSFEHHALNRSVFAEGAIKAARWIVGQKAGFYSMVDMLKRKS